MSTQPMKSLTVVAVFFFTACTQPEFEMVRAQKILMDTFVSVTVFLPPDSSKARAEKEIAALWQRLAQLDSMLSNYRDDNEIAAINKKAFAEPVPVSPMVQELLVLSQRMSERTGGAFDITVGALTRLWGFGRKPAVPEPQQLENARAGVGFHFLQLDTIGSTIKFNHPQTEIDLGGFAKGAIIDAAYHQLKRAGYRDFLIDAGGDLRMAASALTAGKRNIWVTHPRKPGDFLARFALDNGAVATTGDYERFFEENGKRYHHILHPATGYPATQAVSATVVATDAATADALATAFFILGPQQAIALAGRLAGVEAMVVYENGGTLDAKATKNLASKMQFFNIDSKDSSAFD